MKFKTFAITASIFTILACAAAAYGQSSPIALQPNTAAKGSLLGVPGDNKAALGAQKLFSVGSCQVWGFTWRGHDHVVSICQPQEDTKK